MGNAIEKIKISGFRRLADFELEMRPFMVLIGANGVGKTSFLDALSVLSASASGDMNKKLVRLGGVKNILTRGKAQKVSFAADVTTGSKDLLRYELELEPNDSGYAVSKELLSQVKTDSNKATKYIDSAYDKIRYYNETDDSVISPDWKHNNVETSLSQAPLNLRKHGELKQLLSTVNRFHSLDVSARAPVRLPQEMRPANLPGINGEDLIPYLYYLREGEPEVFETLIDTIKPVFPDFESIGFPPVAAGMLSMVWNDSKFDKPLYIHELSEGILRYLWLLSLLYSPHLSPIAMLDEPEVSLHPELLSLLVDVMRETSMNNQLIVATHSDSLIRFLQPEEIVVMDIDDDGFSTATWADTMDLDAWLSEYSLDEVWHMGRMGGRQ